MLKITNLQEELQSAIIAEAKSQYESNLALTYAHNNNNKIFQLLKVTITTPVRCSTMTSKHQLTQKKPSFSMTIFILYSLLATS